MNLQNKWKNYGFWVSLVSAVILLAQTLGVEISTAEVMEIVNPILALLVALGVISDADKGSGYIDK